MAAPAGPFSFPTSRFAGGMIKPPVVPVARNTLRDGASKSRIVGAAFLSGSWRTPPMTKADVAKWEAFFANLRSGSRTFLGYDVRRPLPVSYTSFTGMVRYGGSAFDGTCGLTAITSVRELVVSVLPVGFLLKAGDWMGVVETVSGVVRYFLAMIAQDATANASGVATVYIEPSLPALFTTAATINFYYPVAEFVIDAIPDVGDGLQPQPVGFTGTSRVF